jgi:hypothetical protein
MRFELMNFLKRESNYTQKRKYYYQCSKINKHLLNEITGKQFYFAFKIDYIVTSYTILLLFSLSYIIPQCHFLKSQNIDKVFIALEAPPDET